MEFPVVKSPEKAEAKKDHSHKSESSANTPVMREVSSRSAGKSAAPHQEVRDPARDSALSRAVQQIEKQFGKGAVMKLNPDQKSNVDGHATGSLGLDIALGGNGVPRGRILEVFGPESSGKTTLTLHIIANVQKGGGVAAFIDAEHALDPSWAKRIGVRLD